MPKGAFTCEKAPSGDPHQAGSTLQLSPQLLGCLVPRHANDQALEGKSAPECPGEKSLHEPRHAGNKLHDPARVNFLFWAPGRVRPQNSLHGLLQLPSTEVSENGQTAGAPLERWTGCNVEAGTGVGDLSPILHFQPSGTQRLTSHRPVCNTR